MGDGQMNVATGGANDKVMAHVASVLEYDNLLCQFIKEHVDFTAGSSYSIDPAGCRIGEIKNFSWGSGARHDICIANGKLVELGSVVEVIAGAYDGEGFIHWTPN